MIAAPQQRHVLIVEDEPLVRMSLAQELQDQGWRVREAGSGTDALKHLKGDAAIDMIITDIQLPRGPNGWDIADAFHAAGPAIRIIYLSGLVIDRTRMVPGSVFFSKPVRMEDLLDACDRLIPREI